MRRALSVRPTFNPPCRLSGTMVTCGNRSLEGLCLSVLALLHIVRLLLRCCPAICHCFLFPAAVMRLMWRISLSPMRPGQMAS